MPVVRTIYVHIHAPKGKNPDKFAEKKARPKLAQSGSEIALWQKTKLSRPLLW
jgi:hypothetical protein